MMHLHDKLSVIVKLEKALSVSRILCKTYGIAKQTPTDIKEIK